MFRHFFANSASMTLTTSGASGVVRGEKRATTSPLRPMMNFSKFQLILPCARGLGVQRGQVLVERAGPVAVDLDLGEEREGDAVVDGAELLDFFSRPRLLLL